MFIIPAIFTALLTLFLEFCFREKMIFSGWLEFLAYRWLKKHNPQLLKKTKGKTDSEILEKYGYESKRDYLFSQVRWFFFKPFGYCIVCFNVWVSIICYPFLDVEYFVFYILISNFLVRYLYNKII